MKNTPEMNQVIEKLFQEYVKTLGDHMSVIQMRQALTSEFNLRHDQWALCTQQAHRMYHSKSEPTICAKTHWVM